MSLELLLTNANGAKEFCVGRVVCIWCLLSAVVHWLLVSIVVPPNSDLLHGEAFVAKQSH